MITIYCDFQRTEDVQIDEFTIVVTEIKDYIPIRQFIRRALDKEDNNYTVYIQSPILAKWLRDLRDYDSLIVCWEEINLQEKFLKKFGFSLPSELDEDAIKDLHLLDLPIPYYAAPTDPSGWILGQLLDPIWRTTKLYSSHLADLSAWAVQATRISLPIIPLVKARLAEWIKTDNNYRIFITCNGQDSWQNVGESILLRWTLRFYPSSLNIQGLDVAPIVDCTPHAQLCHDILKQHEVELNSLWNIWLTVNSPLRKVEKAVSSMSGLADVELNIIEKWAQNNPENLTFPLIDAIRDKFSRLPQSVTVLRRLELLVPPPLPQQPDDNWSTDKWLNWATDEYMPYFDWVIRNRQSRNYQMQLADRFADWMVSHYPQLLFSPNIVTNQLSRVRELLDCQQADVVLWFIIDGLTWWQGKRLSTICIESGIGVTEIRPALSALPSVTSVSKRAIVQGYVDRTATTQSISQLILSRLANDQTDVSVYTQPQELELAIAAIADNSKPKIYTLLYNALDDQNHHSTNFTDDESVDGHLQLIARLANQSFQQCLQRGLKVKLLVISDHGSTLLPQECAVKKLPNFASEFNDDDAPEEETISNTKNIYHGTRSCAIENTPSDEEIRNLEQDWYYLAKEPYNLPLDFLIPKGYAAVNRRPKGWTHGGATPEETVVTYIELQPTPIEIMQPIVSIEGYLTPTQASALQVAIKNPNSAALKSVRLTISGTQAHITWSMIPAVSTSVEEIQIPVISNSSTQTIEWLLNYEVIGQSRQFSGQTEVSIRRFQVNPVDELFDI